VLVGSSKKAWIEGFCAVGMDISTFSVSGLDLHISFI
jgi:hypothetical protein